VKFREMEVAVLLPSLGKSALSPCSGRRVRPCLAAALKGAPFGNGSLHCCFWGSSLKVSAKEQGRE